MTRRTTVCLLTDERVHAVSFDGRGRRPSGRGSVQHRVPNSLLSGHDPQALAETIGQAIAGTGRPAGSVTLVVPLQWCFTHLLVSAGKRATPEALAYRFEEYLPIPLEDLTCAFLRLDGDCVLAAGIPTEPMAALLDALSTGGIEVEHITVDAVAACGISGADSPPWGVLIVDSRWARVISSVSDSSGIETQTIGLDEDKDRAHALGEQLRSRMPHTLLETRHWRAIDLAGDGALEATVRDALGETGSSLRFVSRDDAVETIATAAAAPPALDLRSGRLAARGRWEPTLRLTQHCLACVLCLLLICIVGMQLRDRALKENLAAVHRAKLQIYRQVFDVTSLPPGATVRLASERIKLEGLTRATSPDKSEQLLPRVRPLALLRNCVANLPSDVRIMLTDARVDGSQLVLRGQTAEHQDAERIAEVVNGAEGLTCRAPRTTRIKGGGVEFSITASVTHDH